MPTTDEAHIPWDKAEELWISRHRNDARVGATIDAAAPQEPDNPGLKIGWVCFHCWEYFPPTFAGQRDAQAHFGGSEMREPACQISKRDHGLLLYVRALEMERDDLRRQLNEDDSAKCRQISAMACGHAEDVRRAEEDGYARAVRDMKAQGYCADPDAHN